MDTEEKIGCDGFGAGAGSSGSCAGSCAGCPCSGCPGAGGRAKAEPAAWHLYGLALLTLLLVAAEQSAGNALDPLSRRIAYGIVGIPIAWPLVRDLFRNNKTRGLRCRIFAAAAAAAGTILYCAGWYACGVLIPLAFRLAERFVQRTPAAESRTAAENSRRYSSGELPNFSRNSREK